MERAWGAGMAEQRHVVPDVVRLAVSLAFLFLVAVATAGIKSPLFFVILVSAGLAIAAIQAMFPVSRLFSIAFANLIAVYVAIFSLFVEEVFHGVSDALLAAGFALPIAAFVAGCWLRRDQVRAVVAHPAIRSERRMLGAFLWLLPTFIIGGGVVLLSHIVEPFADSAGLLLGAMALIGIIVFTVSRDVAIFLVDSGLLFEEFFHRISRLVIPAFAFLTFYSLLVILFGSIYHILSQYTADAHFEVDGIPRALSFSESIYFSIVSISTVGYGDIVPHSSLARVLASIEIVCGFMLLLFGVSELLEYTREHRERTGYRRGTRTPRR
jgi:voltage-gated potassium channel